MDADRRVRRDDGHPVEDCLRNETAVERIRVVLRQAVVVGCAILVEGKLLDPEPFVPAGDVDVGRQRQGQPAQAALDRDFPRRQGTEADRVVRVQTAFPRLSRQLRIVGG